MYQEKLENGSIACPCGQVDAGPCAGFSEAGCLKKFPNLNMSSGARAGGLEMIPEAGEACCDEVEVMKEELTQTASRLQHVEAKLDASTQMRKIDATVQAEYRNTIVGLERDLEKAKIDGAMATKKFEAAVANLTGLLGSSEAAKMSLERENLIQGAKLAQAQLDVGSANTKFARLVMDYDVLRQKHEALEANLYKKVDTGDYIWFPFFR